MGYSPWGRREVDTTEQLTHMNICPSITFPFQNFLVILIACFSMQTLESAF